MALAVLDGNQSATTLSSVVTGGEHIVAHSVVSLGSTAISNITTAVSGAVVTIPSLAKVANSVATDGVLDSTTNFIKIGGHQSGANQTAHIVHVSNGGAMSVDASGSSVTFSQASVTFGAITGSASILNFPVTQTVAGTVTANDSGALSIVNSSTITKANTKFTAIAGAHNPSDYAGTYTLTPINVDARGIVYVDGQAVGDRGTCVTYNPSTGETAWKTKLVESSVTIGSLPAISGTVTANVFGYSDNEASYQPIPVVPWDEGVSSGRAVVVKVQQEGVGSLPISGVVTANVAGNLNSAIGQHADLETDYAVAIGFQDTFDAEFRHVSNINPLPISGTVTVGNNNFNIKTVIAQDGSANFTAFNGTQFRLYTPTGASKTLNNIFGAIPSWVVAFSDSVTWFSDSGTQVAYFHDGTQWTLDDFTTPAGTLALDGSVFITNLSSESSINLLNGFTASQVGSAYLNGSGALRVNLYSSTVTAAAPNGSLTTRFGTPVTANQSFATSAVTNTSRKYLLIQNVTTQSNVITVGIGFTPTTTQGIQLTAGAGITFESSYIPTGQIYILSSVTASNFTILEA